MTLRRVILGAAALFALGIVVGFAAGLLQPRRASQPD